MTSSRVTVSVNSRKFQQKSLQAEASALSFVQFLRGHYLTLMPFLSRGLRPVERPETEAWTLEVEDLEVGPVRLSGRFLRRSREEVVVCLHGLGGSSESGYMALLLKVADKVGVSCLLLNCRGADRGGADIYHSGLFQDLSAALGSQELSTMESVHILGYSIGGHIALRYACSEVDPRVTRVAVVGAPVELAAAADDFDAARFNVYRSHVLDGLKEIYTAAYQRRPQGLHPMEARKIKRIRDWDEWVIAPRFGFDSADHYYESQSVGPRLSQLKRKVLYVGAICDPMVKIEAVLPYMGAEHLEAVWDERAGHLGFSPEFDLGQEGEKGLEAQVLAWLRCG